MQHVTHKNTVMWLVMPPLNKCNTCCLEGEEGSSKAKGENPDRKLRQTEGPYGWKHSHPPGKVGHSPVFLKIFSFLN
jgi:hypothetical protein